MFLCMRAKFQLVNKIDYFTKVVTAVYFIFEFAEYFTNLILNSSRRVGFHFKPFQVRKKFVVYKIYQVVARCCGIVIQFSFSIFRRSPYIPTVIFLNDIMIILANKFSLGASFALKVIQIF